MANVVTLSFLAITFAVAAAAMLLTTRLLNQTKPTSATSRTRHGTASGSDVLRAYRFGEGYLLSDIDADDAFLDTDVDRSAAFKRLVKGLAPLSPDFTTCLNALRDRGEAFMIDGRIGPDCVSIGGRIDNDDGILVLSVGPSGEHAGRQTVDTAALDALQGELADLRAALNAGISPMWRVDARGRVIWANAPYFDLAQRLRDGEDPGWPLPQIFADRLDAEPTEGTATRCALDLPDRDEASWFEVSRDILPGGAMLYTALPYDRVVRAESTLREFLQTTAKTFAALPIGLAVFDSKRQLVTFNPALCTLTDVGGQFLSSRPVLSAFLDQLRERKRIPEPRNYISWRDEIARLEEGAENGTYHEMWELPEGKTFRVIGRPHPDGAIAFIFEDISAEVSLTRQFRADLDMYQGVLDAAPSAIAVFDADGAMIGFNEGYTRLWSEDSATPGDLPSFRTACAQWSARCQPTDLWSDIAQFVSHKGDRTAHVDVVQTVDGARIAVRIAPTRARATVIHFIPLEGDLNDPLADLALKSTDVVEDATPVTLDTARSA